MFTEERIKTFCPIHNSDVEIVKIINIEGGGSCQVDIDCVDLKCEDASECIHSHSCSVLTDLIDL